MANYGEELGYWYLRLNGFFPITNFVIHQSGGIEYPTDCDILGVRFSHVYEEIGGQIHDWDETLTAQVDFNMSAAVIYEVKTGNLGSKPIFCKEKISYAVKRLGIIEDPTDILRDLEYNAISERDGWRVFKLLLAYKHPRMDEHFIFINIRDVKKFLIQRFRKYDLTKYRDRIFFNSALIQFLIDDVTYDLYGRSIGRFYEEHFSSFIGDRRLNIPHVDALKDIAREFEARSALALSAKEIIDA